MPRYVLPLLLLIALAIGAVYRVKGAVYVLEDELRLVEAGIEDATWRIKGLETDLAYLTRPARMATLAAEIGMRPVTAGKIIEPERLGKRRELELAGRPLTVRLGSGGEVTWRAKPAVPFTLVAGEDG